MRTLVLALTMAAVFLTGCTSNNAQEPPSEEIQESIPVSITEYEDGFQIFSEKELVSGLYEPEEGCYLGAYILSDKTADGKIENFERITGVTHGFYTYVMKMGQPFPSEWVLDCISNMKTPNIILVPENNEDPFNSKLLESTAKSFGELYVPMFVHLYPVDGASGYSSEEYVSFYKVARAYFSRYASNVAFVWDINADNLDLALDFYPGDDYTDWVGINAYLDMDPDGENTPDKLISAIGYFYSMFQEKKPIFLSQLGISHFSSTDYAYYVNEAKEALESVYASIQNSLPRVKAVNYMSYSSVEPVNMAQGNDNYSVADDGRMAQAYKNTISGSYFLSELDYTAGGEGFVQKISYPFEAIYHEGEFYADGYFLDAVLNGRDESGGTFVLAMGKAYYPLEAGSSGYSVQGDFSRRTVAVLHNGG